MYDGRTYGLYKTINVKFNYLNSADFPDHTGYMRHDAYIDGRSRGVNFGEYTTSNGTKLAISTITPRAIASIYTATRA